MIDDETTVQRFHEVEFTFENIEWAEDELLRVGVRELVLH